MAQKKGGFGFFNDRDHQWPKEYRPRKDISFHSPVLGTGLVNRTGASMGRGQERVPRRVGIPGLGRVWGEGQAELVAAMLPPQMGLELLLWALEPRKIHP